ncbi:hypothetical protein ACQPYE_21390 [Actinosynnema sp. CA-299493]
MKVVELTGHALGDLVRIGAEDSRLARPDGSAVLRGVHVREWTALESEVTAVDRIDPVVPDRSGFRSAEVIVPGTLPRTFGGLDPRTHGTGPLLPHPIP